MKKYEITPDSYKEFIKDVDSHATITIDLINRIKQIRQKCGMTKSELARKIGVNQRTITRAENGHFYTPKLLVRFLSVTDFSISFVKK